MAMEEEQHDLEMPEQPYTLALWNLIIRPPRRRYHLSRLGPAEFRLWSCGVKRLDVDLTNSRGQKLRCSHFLPQDSRGKDPRPCVIYLHQNASCRLEALQLIPLLLPLGITLFCFDFVGCGESDGDYVSLGWFERDDLADCVKYLRDSGKVSSIGLWGRSMGAVTALLHADRDHSIAGMVLDSPFCNLRQLVGELAQSDYLTLKVPSWLLSAALALIRARIRSLCNFDIDELSPEEHVGNSFIPALFLHGSGDDFIAPHHTEKLHQAYNGDKEMELVAGDHNTPREYQVIRKAVFFLVQALRCNVEPTPNENNLAAILGFHAMDADSIDRKVLRGQILVEAARMLALSAKCQIQGDLLQAAMSFRLEGVVQLKEQASEAGYCFGLLSLPTDHGGANQPPVVLMALIGVDGLKVVRLVEGKEPEIVAKAAFKVELGVPVMMLLEMRSAEQVQFTSYFGPVQPPVLKLKLMSGGPTISWTLDQECKREMFFWHITRGGNTDFFETDIKDLEIESALAECVVEPEADGVLTAEVEDRPQSPLSAGDQQLAPSAPSITSCCRQS